MKLTLLVTLAMAVGVIAGKKPGKPDKPPKPLHCEIETEWGFGWCEKSPFNYRCNNRGRVEWDKWAEQCNIHSRCRCDSKA